MNRNPLTGGRVCAYQSLSSLSARRALRIDALVEALTLPPDAVAEMADFADPAAAAVVVVVLPNKNESCESEVMTPCLPV
jgi:hypothetical protein